MVATPKESLLSALVFEEMRLVDLPEVMHIEKTSYPFPWTEGIFSDCLRVGYYCCAVKINYTVVAYAVMSIAAGEAHILNVCVSPDYSGRGIGRVVMRHLMDYAANNNVEMILLEVRPSNHIAIRLYDSLGFNEIGARKNYYPADNGREDGVVMALTIL